jgi:lysozyme
MKTSPEGLEAIRQRESLRLKAYKDGGGVWTIGYGHTLTAKEGTVISEFQAHNLLALDIICFENAVNLHVVGPLKQCEFDALVSFAFNLGVGWVDPSKCTAVYKLNAGDRHGFARNFVRFCKDNGSYVEGLNMRRGEELYQFMGGT